MATGKVFYWIKLKDSFMTSEKVDFLMAQKDGANYIVLYQMLCLKCMNTNGVMARQIGEIMVQYDVDKIVRDCKWFSRDTVIVALELYKQLGMIYKQENGMLAIADFNNMVGKETDYAIQKRAQREQEEYERLIAKYRQDVDKPMDNVHTEIRDKSLDTREEEKERDKKGKSRKGKTPTTETTTQIFDRLIADYSISEPLIDKMRDWITYKTERKEAYKEQGLKALLRRVETEEQKNGAIAIINLIDECMGNNWKGIIWDRLGKKQGNYGTNKRDLMQELYEA